MRSAVRVASKTVALVAVIIVLAPLQRLILACTRGPASMRLPRLFHRATCAVLGLHVEVRGAPTTAERAIYLCNHLSHLDIPVLGSLLRACFVAKDDIRDWPVFGPLARLQHTVFIDRNARRAGDAGAMLATAVDAGHRLVLFPEGTTSDGSAVLPFKSSIFAMLVDPAMRQVMLQPMTLELLAVDGRAIPEGGDRDRYAYYGDMQLLPHLLAFMRTSGARLRVSFHAPLQRTVDDTRKTLAVRAHACVSQRGADGGAGGRVGE